MQSINITHENGLFKLWEEKTDDCLSSNKFCKNLSRIEFHTVLTFSLANIQERDKKKEDKH